MDLLFVDILTPDVAAFKKPVYCIPLSLIKLVIIVITEDSLSNSAVRIGILLLFYLMNYIRMDRHDISGPRKKRKGRITYTYPGFLVWILKKVTIVRIPTGFMNSASPVRELDLASHLDMDVSTINLMKCMTNSIWL